MNFVNKVLHGARQLMDRATPSPVADQPRPFHIQQRTPGIRPDAPGRPVRDRKAPSPSLAERRANAAAQLAIANGHIKDFQRFQVKLRTPAEARPLSPKQLQDYADLGKQAAGMQRTIEREIARHVAARQKVVKALVADAQRILPHQEEFKLTEAEAADMAQNVFKRPKKG